MKTLSNGKQQGGCVMWCEQHDAEFTSTCCGVGYVDTTEGDNVAICATCRDWAGFECGPCEGAKVPESAYPNGDPETYYNERAETLYPRLGLQDD